ncbi:MAG: hypothetical protein J5885_05140 [Clostridia bacterium]|nr:hypothetical protein [Clostridia bacterium]
MRRSLFLLCLCFLLLLSGCRSVGNASSAQWKKPFTASIEGTRGELAFSAELTVTATDRVIRYTAPESLAGLTATATAGGIRVVQGELSRQDGSGATGLLLPLDLLVSPAELATVQKRGDETVLTYTDGTEIFLNADGTPRAVIRTDILFTVSDFSESKP